MRMTHRENDSSFQACQLPAYCDLSMRMTHHASQPAVAAFFLYGDQCTGRCGRKSSRLSSSIGPRRLVFVCAFLVGPWLAPLLRAGPLEPGRVPEEQMSATPPKWNQSSTPTPPSPPSATPKWNQSSTPTPPTPRQPTAAPVLVSLHAAMRPRSLLHPARLPASSSSPTLSPSPSWHALLLSPPTPSWACNPTLPPLGPLAPS